MLETTLFQRRVQRLETRITRLEIQSRRYSWARLVVFLTGATAAWVAGLFLGGRVGWGLFAFVVVFFIIIAIRHRRVDDWIKTLYIWQALYREKTARLTLDWDHIPRQTPTSEASSSPLSLDLDLTGHRSLHHLIDTSVSRQGSRKLSAWFSTDTPDAQAIASRQAVISDLSGMPRFRNRLALSFRRLSREPLEGDRLLEWLRTEYPQRRLRRLLPWVTLLAFGNLALFVLWSTGHLPAIWILTTLVYAGLYFSSQSMIEEFLEAIFHLDGELRKFAPLLRFLETYPYGNRPALRRKCAIFLDKSKLPSHSIRRLKPVTALAGLRMNPALGLLFNLVSPWDFWTAWMADRQRQEMSEKMPEWLEAFQELDALISLGEFAGLHPEYHFPTIRPIGNKHEVVFSATGLGHPLIPAEKKVCNDLQINALGTLLIITGSNMSGKSTFIRTIGINLCLAYAGGPVNATALITLPFRLYTCIRINDSLGDGFSYFYAEVKRLKGLIVALEPASSGLPLLYLVDEIFRGTNNRERLIGSRAYIKALIGSAGVGLIATHDLELANLVKLNPLARNVHFQDDVTDGKLTFDYKLRSGPSLSTNALKIMRLEGLPVPEVDEKNPPETANE
jgi:ABC-type multidrug transport system fused ATPase/permease subunit